MTKLRVTGNILQLFDLDGWKYHRHILDRCEFCIIFLFDDLADALDSDGQASKITGAFGVRD